MDIPKPNYRIVVRDAKQHLIEDANIKLAKLQDKAYKKGNQKVQLEKKIRNFSLQEIYANTFYEGNTPLEPGTYLIRVEAKGMEAQERIIEVTEQGFVSDFFLGRPGVDSDDTDRQSGHPDHPCL